MILIKLRAMIVDDSPETRHATMEAMKRTGLAEFAFAQAGDGLDALRKMTTDDFHIGIVDWKYPNRSSLDFVRTVRTAALDAKQEPIPFVLFSSERTLGHIQEAMDETGADAFICKPYTPVELTKKLDRLVQMAVDVRVRRMRADHRNAAPITGSVFAKLFG